MRYYIIKFKNKYLRINQNTIDIVSSVYMADIIESNDIQELREKYIDKLPEKYKGAKLRRVIYKVL